MKLLDNPDIHKNDQGHKLYRAGSKTEGLKLIKEAALNGQPNAIASLVWFQIIDDDIKNAITDYELCIKQADSWIASEKLRVDKLWLVSAADKNSVIAQYKYQISNCKSNAALAYLASRKEKIAIDLWNQAAEDHGHIEARFYPIFHLCKSNPDASIGILKNSFTKHELQDLIGTMIKVSTQGNGWFSKWAQQGLAVLKKASQGQGGKAGGAKAAVAASGAAFVAAKNLNKFVKDQMEESFSEGEDVSDWFSDLF